jgi:hypothetical protein
MVDLRVRRLETASRMLPPLNQVHRQLIVAVGAALIYFVGLGGPALWEPDEGRYAEIAREMVVSGDYLTPHNDWVRYFEKPPLVYWASAAAIKAFGRNEFAVRSQAALASVGSVVVTAALAEAISGATVGILSAIALGLSPLFFIFARFASPDPALAFFLTAALAAFYAAASGTFRAGASRKWMLAAAALLGVGTLSKGPVALVLVGAIGLLWLLAEGRARELLTIRWLECAAIYLAIVAPWFALVATRNPGFLQFFFVHEHLERFTASTEHGWGPWFFIPVVIAGMWPFSYFVPLGMRALSDSSEDPEQMRRRSALRFLLIWFAVVFLFFSIPRSKLGEYILPGIPPLAILAAVGLGRMRVMERARAVRIVAWYAFVNTALLAIVVLSISPLIHQGVIPPHESFPFFHANSARGALIGDTGLLVLILSVSSVILWSLMRRYGSRRIPNAIGLTAALVACVLGKARFDATSMVSYRELAETVAPHLRGGCTLVSYHHFVQSIPFYTESRELLAGYRGELAPFGDSRDAVGTFIATDKQLSDRWSGRECVILIANRVDLPKLEDLLTPRARPLACEGKKVALANRSLSLGPGNAPDCMKKQQGP